MNLIDLFPLSRYAIRKAKYMPIWYADESVSGSIVVSVPYLTWEEAVAHVNDRLKHDVDLARDLSLRLQ